MTPQDVKTKNSPVMTSESTTALGTVLRGSVLSSASGATDSKPANANTEKTIPRNRPLELVALDGSNGVKLTPPGPGRSRPVIASATQTRISNAPISTMNRMEILSPK